MRSMKVESPVIAVLGTGGGEWSAVSLAVPSHLSAAWRSRGAEPLPSTRLPSERRAKIPPKEFHCGVIALIPVGKGQRIMILRNGCSNVISPFPNLP